MIKVLFICHGNICRSAAAEMVMKQMAREQGRKDLQIASAAATREEIGNDIYPPMKKALTAAGRPSFSTEGMSVGMTRITTPGPKRSWKTLTR